MPLAASHPRGFTLIEVLISMVILSIGLLGLGTLQLMSLRDNMDAYNYQQATLLAYEMQDRIRSNNVTIDDPTFDWTAVAANQGTSCNSLANVCTPAQLAAFDFWYWEYSVSKTLPAPNVATNKRVEIKKANTVMKSGCKGTYGDKSLCLITRWKRANTAKTGVLSNDATFYLEVTI
jgi:type IV pilus assembly protein PilV